jgi:WXXGXW repeat (2 copies)
LNARSNWKSKLLVGALTMAAVAATGFSTPASAQIAIVIGRQPPPPMRYERRPPMPGEGYAWVDGYWGNNGGRYVWVPGRWDHAPYAGAYWSHPHYDHYQDGWHLHEGHWDKDDHGDHYNDHHDDHHDDRR